MKNKRKIRLSGAMTLEASIALPLFIFFFLNIMSAISIIQIQSDMEAVLHQTGSELMQLAFDINTGKEVVLGGGTDEAGLAEAGALSLYASKSVRNSLEDRLKNSMVMDGAEDLNFLSSKIMQGDDIIDIVVDYKVHPVVKLVGFTGFGVESRFYGHAWTGYDISGGLQTDLTEEEMVYVTEHGTVFHRDVNCTHLKSSARSVAFSGLSGERNADRGRYYPCEYCGNNISGGNVFVTTYGNRYHGRIDCPGLKRKIYTIPISEAGGRGPCSSCG
ncbi:MAG: hypothetical protein II842_09040 [Butyrivibrio sp.]|nr:hypothetical protein [Butyrivibrio sp.]